MAETQVYWVLLDENDFWDMVIFPGHPTVQWCKIKNDDKNIDKRLTYTYYMLTPLLALCIDLESNIVITACCIQSEGLIGTLTPKSALKHNIVH